MKLFSNTSASMKSGLSNISNGFKNIFSTKNKVRNAIAGILALTSPVMTSGEVIAGDDTQTPVHKVVSGDTFYAVADFYGIDRKLLEEMNPNIKNIDVIIPGRDYIFLEFQKPDIHTEVGTVSYEGTDIERLKKGLNHNPEVGTEYINAFYPQGTNGQHIYDIVTRDYNIFNSSPVIKLISNNNYNGILSDGIVKHFQGSNIAHIKPEDIISMVAKTETSGGSSFRYLKKAQKTSDIQKRETYINKIINGLVGYSNDVGVFQSTPGWIDTERNNGAQVTGNIIRDTNKLKGVMKILLSEAIEKNFSINKTLEALSIIDMRFDVKQMGELIMFSFDRIYNSMNGYTQLTKDQKIELALSAYNIGEGGMYKNLQTTLKYGGTLNKKRDLSKRLAHLKVSNLVRSSSVESSIHVDKYITSGNHESAANDEESASITLRFPEVENIKTIPEESEEIRGVSNEILNNPLGIISRHIEEQRILLSQVSDKIERSKINAKIISLSELYRDTYSKVAANDNRGDQKVKEAKFDKKMKKIITAQGSKQKLIQAYKETLALKKAA